MEPFIGQLMLVGFNFPPRGWALCEGQLLSISQNTALFSLLGTTYGGDGRSTFGLPDLRGRVNFSPGTGPGLSPHSWGQKGGVENVTLATNQIPSHNHLISGANAQGDDSDPTTGNGFGAASNDLFVESTPGSSMGSGTVKNTGGGQSHTNVQPYIAMYWCIALTGIFPSRN